MIGQLHCLEHLPSATAATDRVRDSKHMIIFQRARAFTTIDRCGEPAICPFSQTASEKVTEQSSKQARAQRLLLLLHLLCPVVPSPAAVVCKAAARINKKYYYYSFDCSATCSDCTYPNHLCPCLTLLLLSGSHSLLQVSHPVETSQPNCCYARGPSPSSTHHPPPTHIYRSLAPCPGACACASA